MTPSRALIVGLVLFLNLTNAFAASREAVPDVFLGLWAGAPSDCGHDDHSDEMMMTITPSEIRFYESAGEIINIEIHGPSEITVRLELWGEGESWEEELRLTVSQKGKLLQTESRDYGPVFRHRCSQQISSSHKQNHRWIPLPGNPIDEVALKGDRVTGKTSQATYA